MKRPLALSLANALSVSALLLGSILSGSLMAAPLDSRDFNDAFEMNGFGHTMTASGGQLVINGTNVNTNGQFLLPGPGAATPFTVSTLVGSDAGSPGSFNVGLTVGDNNVVFHPGFGGAALRVEGPGGFGNQTLAFTPAVGALHTLTVTGDGAGNFTLQLQNGSGPGVYNNVWTNAGNPLTQIGVRRSGGTFVNANYDNLSVPPSPLGAFSQNFVSTMGTIAGVSGTVSAVGGQLRMTSAGAATNSYLVPGQAGNLLVSGGIGSTPGSGNTNVGIQVGGNNIVFHPNLAGGAFRVEGTGGFGNTGMGFNPAGGVLHNMEVAIDAATGRFTIATADANNPDNVFAARFTNAAYSPASQIGFRYSTGAAGDTGIFDNLAISQLEAATDGNADWVSAVQASNPRHWYRLSETTSNIAIDQGSAAQHGVFQNGVVKGLAGVTNGAAGFDGINDQVNLGAADLSGPWTAEFIVNKQGLEDAGSLLTSAGGALRLDQWQNTGEIGFTDFGNADFLFAPGAFRGIDLWSYIAFVAEPSDGIDLYVDGVLVGTNPNYIDLPLTAIGGADTANMFLDEVVIFDRALSPDEIFAHAQAAGLAVPEPQSIALWAVACAVVVLAAGKFRRSN